jgi:hypothetical protein
LLKPLILFNELARYDQQCDGTWETAQADNLAGGIHGSFGARMKGFSSERYSDNTFYDHMITHPFGQMAVTMDVIAAGVLDRFPQLRVGFFEIGLSWMKEQGLLDSVLWGSDYPRFDCTYPGA